MTEAEAEILAAEVLSWILSDRDLAGTFLGSTGIAAGDLAQALAEGDPAVLGAILDFLLMDDAWVIGFCESADQPYDAPARARAALPGGASYHWT